MQLTPMTPDERAQMLSRLPALPQAMRERQQWLVWRFERYDGDKKARKVPYYVSGDKRTGTQGSEADRQALCTFERALAELGGSRYNGLGFAFLPGDGLIGIDIDGAVDPSTGEVSERCQAIIQACGSYTEWSPSGTGVHIIVAGETETFKDNSIGLEVFCGRQFFACTGLQWDGTPPDVAAIDEVVLRRLRATVKGAKHAAAAGHSSPAQPVEGVAKAGQRARRYCMAALEKAEQALRGTGEGGRNDALNEAAFGLAQLLHLGGFSETVLRATLTDAAMAVGLGEREIATTLRSAIAAGVQQPRALPVSAPRPRKGGGARPQGAPTPSAGSAGDGGGAGGPPDGPPEEAADDWRRLLLRERGGKKDCRENVYLTLLHHPDLAGLVAFDEFAHRVVKLRPPPWGGEPGEWIDQDDYQLGMWLAMNERMPIRSEGTLVAGVAMAAHQARFHPVLRWLDALPAWDGVPRLKYWLSECLGADPSTYTELVGSWFVMGMVQRVKVPGCQMDYMIVLEGGQGQRKSTALRTLVGNDEWFADTPIRIGDKDALLSLVGKWLYEVGELDAFNKAEVTAVKQYVSSRIDRVREPFARRPVDRPRSGVFAGSTNQSEYFKDPTGARRFWPVTVRGEIDLEKLAQWRAQLFAEALSRLDSADADERRYYPTREETERYLVPEQEAREIGDPWHERLAQWLESRELFGDSGVEIRLVEKFTTAELLTRCLIVPTDRIDGGRQMATRVGLCMHRLGWVKRRDGDGVRVWRYWRPGCSPKPAGAVDEGSAGGPVGELHEF